MKGGKMKTAFVTVLVLLLIPMAAQATTLTFDLNIEFSGATPPEGATPWLTATFDDSFGDDYTVRLTMSADGLTGTETVDDWLFNFSGDPTGLTFDPFDTTDLPDGLGDDGILTGSDSFMADGDGYFDIRFDFPPPPGSKDKFAAGETVIYDITYDASPITVSSFNFASAPGGGQGEYKSAAHIQSIGGEDGDSGWIGPCDGEPIPEPGTLLLIGSGLAGFVGYSGFRRKKK
jgi:hypothetical protein